MLNLPLHEMILWTLVIVIYSGAAVVGVVQLLGESRRYSRYLVPLMVSGAVLEAAVLVARAVTIKAVPLTGIFESLVVLTMVFVLAYLFLGTTVHRVWFGSLVVWVILGLVILAAMVAEPASTAQEAASTPWAIAHAIAMILGGAAATLATASAVLYLLGRHKLKQKKVLQVLGKVPNIERLQRMNMLSLRACFVLMSLGLASGIGLATISSSLNMTGWDWATDPKIVLITAVWVLLGLVLVLCRSAKLKERTVAYVTIVAFALILFAVVGTSVFCGSGHKFTGRGAEAPNRLDNS